MRMFLTRIVIAVMMSSFKRVVQLSIAVWEKTAFIYATRNPFFIKNDGKFSLMGINCQLRQKKSTVR